MRRKKITPTRQDKIDIFDSDLVLVNAINDY